MAKKKKLKKINLNPATGYIVLIFCIVLLSFVLSIFNVSGTYSSISAKTGELENTIVQVNNLLSYSGIKEMISNATINFLTSTTLITLIITLIGVGIAEATGLVQTFMKRHLGKINPKVLTFVLFLLAIFSSIVNEVGYAVLIPLGALLFLFNGRNPLAGIASAFAGVAFGYSISFFVGTMDIDLISYTTSAANLIDSSFYVRMTSNIFIMIISCIVLAIVGTLITEKIIVKKLGRYVSKHHDDLGKTIEIEYLDLQYEEQKKIEEATLEKRGLKFARIAAILVLLIFIYMIIPGLPLSGMLLDYTKEAYVDQLFGTTSYFQDGFTYMMALFFMITGIAYGVGAKSIKDDKDLFNKLGDKLSKVGNLFALTFFAAQFIAIFKSSNIGTVIVAWITDLMRILPFTGIILIITVLLLIALANIFMTGTTSKWAIMAPVIVPLLMQLNISPQFSQFIFRVGSSITNGITPLLAYFVIYLGYLNIYNKDTGKTFSIGQGIKLMIPYLIGFFICWLIILTSWYIIGIPLGPGVYPTI